MKGRGHADLPLHGGRVPYWLAERMKKLGGAITESIVMEYGISEFFNRLSDPLWFQSFGCALGMDWHSSGITTSVMNALKKALNPMASDLGIYVCGGRGKQSLKTPNELITLANKTGLDGHALVRSSKLTAKVDNTTIQDGYQLYLHNFIVSKTGEWAVIQQGMNHLNGMARRYHWHSSAFKSYVDSPHTGISGLPKGPILNLAHTHAKSTRNGIINITQQLPMDEIRKIVMPRHHEVKAKDVHIKRLGAILALSQDQGISDFEELLLLKGLGPRTLQSLTLVSEVIHGTPSRFEDPARFSFAHGGKDGHPFPVPTKVYDQTINTLRSAIDKAKIGYTDKSKAIKSLHMAAKKMEDDFRPQKNQFKSYIEKERKDAHLHGGRTVFGKSKPANSQLSLF